MTVLYKNKILSTSLYYVGEIWPCGGLVVALRGSDGKELWQVGTHHEVFNINCDTIDINGDGTKDCLCSGRMATFLAIDPIKGRTNISLSNSNVSNSMGIFFEEHLVPYNCNNEDYG